MDSSKRRNRTRRDTSLDNRRRSGGQRILYDANGVRIKQSRFPLKLKRALLFYVLPYIVINAIIFFLVTATPKVDMSVGDTSDYRTTQVEFKVDSMLPISEMTVQMESQPIEYTEVGRNHFVCDVSANGMLYVTVKSINGMQTNNYVSVSILDDTAPSIDEESCVISRGELTFVIEDSQSGVDYDSIYGIYDGNKEVKPTKMDTATGTVTIPMYSDSIELHFEDMVGNARMGVISSTTGDYEESGDETASAEASAASEAEGSAASETAEESSGDEGDSED